MKALARDAVFRRFEMRRQFLHGLLIQSGLSAAQMAEGPDLRFVGQIGDDAFVGFQAAHDIGADKGAQRRIGVMRLIFKIFNEAGKLLGRTQ